jgi:DNA-binding NarL/FixJ family response regulator
MPNKLKIRILLVDDNTAFLKLFAKLLQTSLDIYEIEAIDVASNGQECIELLQLNSYNVVFMDVEMPIIGGVEATKYILEHHRGVKVFAISNHCDLGKIQKMLEAGARNYLVKEKISPEIIKDLFLKYPFTIH